MKPKPYVKQILYLCDGKRECNKSKGCVFNGGEDCMHTVKPAHAKNQPIILPTDDPKRYKELSNGRSFFLFVEKTEDEIREENMPINRN